MNDFHQLKRKLKDAGLKLTPQRIVILEAIFSLDNHPTAENITDHIRKKHSNIAIGTVYNVLDALVEKRIIRKVRTEKDIMRYDGNIVHHHHLYCATCDIIEDYKDQELDQILHGYFSKKDLPGFTIEEIKLEIKGHFDRC